MFYHIGVLINDGLVLSLFLRFVDLFLLKRNQALIHDENKAIALVSIRSHRLTIFPAILEALEALPAVPADTFTAPELPGLDILDIGSSMSTGLSPPWIHVSLRERLSRE